MPRYRLSLLALLVAALGLTTVAGAFDPPTYAVYVPQFECHPGAAGADCLGQTHTPTATATPGLKGLAQADWSTQVVWADRQTLNVGWWYAWSEACTAATRAQGCVDMVRNWQLPRACYPYLLVGNEPEYDPPSGSDTDPVTAAAAVKAIEAMCPDSLLIVGNTNDPDWQSAFFDAYEADGSVYRNGWGLHCYGFTMFPPDACGSLTYHRGIPARAAAARARGAVEIWVTEFNCPCSDSQWRGLMDVIAHHTDRWAAYTSRQPAAGYTQGWAYPGLDLIEATSGTPSAKGWAYATGVP